MDKIQNTLHLKHKTLPRKNSWWVPVWKGLVVDEDAKHRTAMGPGVWLFLYLLFAVNRKTGFTRRKQKEMAGDLRLSVRTVQKHLARLRDHGYISVEAGAKVPHIRIRKWKLFKQPRNDDS